MLKMAEAEFNADLANSWFVGDTTMDVQTGINAGMHTVLLQGGDPNKGKYAVTPEMRADNLFDAVKRILSRENE